MDCTLGSVSTFLAFSCRLDTGCLLLTLAASSILLIKSQGRLEEPTLYGTVECHLTSRGALCHASAQFPAILQDQVRPSIGQHGLQTKTTITRALVSPLYPLRTLILSSCRTSATLFQIVSFASLSGSASIVIRCVIVSFYVLSDPPKLKASITDSHPLQFPNYICVVQLTAHPETLMSVFYSLYCGVNRIN